MKGPLRWICASTIEMCLDVAFDMDAEAYVERTRCEVGEGIFCVCFLIYRIEYIFLGILLRRVYLLSGWQGWQEGGISKNV